MYLEAHLDIFTLSKLIEQATPVRLHFSQSSGDERWIEVARPIAVRLVEGRGIVIETSARIHYAWAGFQPEIEIRTIELLLSPIVVREEAGLELHFQLEIEDADLVDVPALLDAGIVSIINAAMTPKNTGLAWGFEKVLRASVPLPDRIEPLTNFVLAATGGSVSVHEDHVKLRVAFASALTRGDAADLLVPAELDAPALPPKNPNSPHGIAHGSGG